MSSFIWLLLLPVGFASLSLPNNHEKIESIHRYDENSSGNELKQHRNRMYDSTNLNENNDDDDASGVATIYSSCSEVTVDGMYYIKPDPELPVLPVICSNGYAMLDASLDFNLLSYPYFLSSHDYGRFDKRYVLSALDDLSTFREWFLIADEETKFRVAPGCMSCESGQFDDNTVYYVDSHTFCFSAAIKAGCTADATSVDYHAESCNQCDVGVWPDDDAYGPNGTWTKCMALQMDADHAIDHDHISCVAHGLTFHPVLSNVRDACTCFSQPAETQVASYEIATSELPLVTARRNQYTNYGFHVADNIQFDAAFASNAGAQIDDQRDTNTVYLYNSDFVSGTLRITQSGTYVLMEDIVFNFNAPVDVTEEEMADESFSPNSIDNDELYWYPTHEQAQPDGPYPGLYSYAGAFTLGFFAGITVEADYVTIDLNGFSLSQHPLFYFQQRFFSLIEMASQPFVPGQGPANWGAGTDVYASHLTIQNGELGLTSHHGIHGNNNDNVVITNINAASFDVTGIQCNKCTNVAISDCAIGPQNNNIPLLGRYTHARSFLPRLKHLIEEHGEEQVQFTGRDAQSVADVAYRLVNQMDMIYHHVVNDVQYDEDDQEWVATQKLFLNPNGWMDGGSSYGLLIGGDGAQVVGMGARHTGTSNISITNVEIHGIYNAVIEKIKYQGNFGATRMIFFDAIDWNAVSTEILNPNDAVYIGDAYTDVTMAVSRVLDSWYYLNSLFVSPTMTEYVFNGGSALGVFHGGCGSDIQLHSSKGAIGLRVDGTKNIAVQDVYIHDIYNWAELGNQEWCGEYDGPNVGNEDIDIQYGYTGTRSHGLVIDYASGTLRNIQIENVESYHGEANGMTVYKECDLTLENVVVDHIHAGTQMDQTQVDALQLPNLTPRACGVDIRPNTVVNVDAVRAGIITGDDIDGFETCYDGENDDEVVAMYGVVRSTSTDVGHHHHHVFHIALFALLLSIVAGIVYKNYASSSQSDDNKCLKTDDLSESTPLLI